MSMTSAADMSSHAVSPELMFSMRPDCASGASRSVAGRRGYGRDWVPPVLRVRAVPRLPDGENAAGSGGLGLHALVESDDVALRVREHRELDRAVLRRRHDRLPA